MLWHVIHFWKLGISMDIFQEPRYVVNVHLLAPNAPTGMLKLLSWRSRTKRQMQWNILQLAAPNAKIVGGPRCTTRCRCP